MKIIYIQDQEIGHCEGRFYYSKSEHFFSRYLYGLRNNDTLVVYTGVIDIPKETLGNYKDVTNPRIKFMKLPEFRKIRNLFSAINQLSRIVKTADFCYLRTGLFSSIISVVCRKNGIPYMSVVNEDVFKNTKCHRSIKVRLSAYPLYWLNRSAILNANYACYVTQEYLQKQYPCMGKTLGCSDIEMLQLDDRVVEYRKEKIKRISGDVVIIGSVGSVSAILKGQDTVIKALASLKGKGVSNFEYQMVGVGEPDRLINLAKELGVEDYIKFIGPLNHDDVLKWFEKIDIYIHPSRSEGLPRTILEAMTKAAPCICSSVGGIPELINSKYLFSYNGNEVSDLVGLIEAMTQDEMIIESERNYNHSKEYDPSILEDRRRIFYESALNEVRRLK